MFRLEQINEHVVKPVKLEKIDESKIKGFYDTIDNLYCTLLILATVKSGKTTAILDILKSTTNRDTILIFFGSTIHNDPVYKVIFKYFKNKGNRVMKFHSIHEEGVDQLKEILNALKGSADDSDSDDDTATNIKIKSETKPKFDMIDVDPIIPASAQEEKQVEQNPSRVGVTPIYTKSKSKYICPEVFFVFDDLSKELRNRTLDTLIKTFRHYKAKIIISCHHCKDVDNDSRANIQYLMLYKGFLKDDDISSLTRSSKHRSELEDIYESFPIRISYSKFKDLYIDATREPHNFLFINVRDNVFRKNFNIEYVPIMDKMVEVPRK
jgi:DNA-dependent RNA polymerase auxiliary subunit epsilon